MRDTIDTLNLPEGFRLIHSMESKYSMLGVFLTILPRLEILSFSDNDVHVQRYTTLGILPPLQTNVDLQSRQYLPAAQTLKFLKVSSLGPLRLDCLNAFQRLHSLDVSMKLAGLNHNDINQLAGLYSGPEPSANFEFIRHLRFDCKIKSVGIWDFAARSGMHHILQAFSRLSSLEFYAEPSSRRTLYRVSAPFHGTRPTFKRIQIGCSRPTTPNMKSNGGTSECTKPELHGQTINTLLIR
jgi:hypothetical protein